MRHLLLGTFLVLAVCGHAQTSTPLLAAQDTLFISFDDIGRKYTQHTLQKGQTLYAVSKYYGLKLKDISLFNPALDENDLAIGTNLLIPIPNRSIHRYQTEKTKDLVLIPILYNVQPGDNLFDIAHRKFNMSVEEFKKSNKLSADHLTPGQYLQLGWFNIAGIDPNERIGNSEQPVFAESERMEKFYSRGEDLAKEEIQEHGMAIWNKDGVNSDLFALHRTASIGSIIAVENPMNSRVVYAKVVGRLPDNIYEEKVRVVLSQKVGQFLGAVDSRFFVKIRYLRS